MGDATRFVAKFRIKAQCPDDRQLDDISQNIMKPKATMISSPAAAPLRLLQH